MQTCTRAFNILVLSAMALGCLQGCIRENGDSPDPLSWLIANEFGPTARETPLIKPSDPVVTTLVAEPADIVFRAIGETRQLSVKATLLDGSTLDVTVDSATRYSSNAPLVADVDARGRLVGLSAGTAVVAVEYKNARALVAVRVDVSPVEPATLVSLDARPDAVELHAAGETQAIQVIGRYSDGLERDLTVDTATTYVSSDASVANVSAAGIIVAQANGSATVTIAHGGKQDSIGVTVAIPPAELLSLSVVPPTFAFDTSEQRLQLFVSGRFSDGTERDLTLDPSIQFRASNLDAVAVSNSGQVAPIASGTAEVIVTNGSMSATMRAQSNVCRPPSPTIDAHVGLTNSASVVISGTAFGAESVQIVGGALMLNAAVTDGRFSIDVPLRENAANVLHITAIAACGARSSPRTTPIVNDNQPPRIFIDYPPQDAELSSDTVDVTGRVADLLSGAEGLTVRVNGVDAAVDVGIGTNGTFVAKSVPIAPDEPTQLLAVATDVAGNQAGAAATVSRLQISPKSSRLELVEGNGQTGSAMHMLERPAVVRAVRPDGSPLTGKLITFRVVRSDGRVGENGGMPTSLVYQVFSDADGIARASWMLGSDAGCGNNRLEASSRDVAGTAVFIAGALPAPPVQVNIGMGNNQRGEAGGPAAEPLRVWVNDGCNGVGNIPVLFRVTRGDGKIAGADTVTRFSTRTGHVDVPFTYGPETGNNEVEVSIPNPGSGSAMFTLYGVSRASNAPTTLSGQILDNSSQPLGGARMELVVGGTIVGSTQTDSNGQFSFSVSDPLVAGPADLYLHAGSISTMNGGPVPVGTRFPDMHFVFTLVPNAPNAMRSPLNLPRLESVNDRVYDGARATDLELTCAGIDGLKMVVKAGTTITLADGRRVGPNDPGSVVLSINQVHVDKIPMPMPDGASPPFAWTFQPGGSKFDIPVRVEYPNMMGLPAGAVGNFLSFDHDTNRFEIVATGTVSADGSVLSSDRGVGISNSGWGGSCPPYPATGDLDGEGNNDDEPENCEGADCAQDPPNCTGGGGGGDTSDGGCARDKGPSQGGACGNDQTDPVNLHSGEFTWSEEDLRIPGRGFDFVWKRTYRSRTRMWNPASADGPIRSAARTSAFGVNWDHSYNLHLMVSPPNSPPGTIWLCDGTGRIDSYRASGDGIWTAAGFFRSLVQNVDGSFTLTHPNQTRVTFAAVQNQTSLFVVLIEDRNGNQMHFEYDDFGRLDTIVDTLGRAMTLLYDAEDRIVALTDFAGREVRYEYGAGAELSYRWTECGPLDALGLPRNSLCTRIGRLRVEGDLVAAIRPAIINTSNGNDFPFGQRIAYEYSPATLNEQANHNLTAIRDARGRETVRNQYETRHISRFGSRQLAYPVSEANPLSPLEVAYISPYKIYVRRFLDRNGIWREVTIEVPMTLADIDYQRSAQGFDDLVTRASDRVVSHTWGDAGQSVSIRYGSTLPTTSGRPGGRATTVTDRNGNETVYRYDGANRLVQKDERTRQLRPTDPPAFTTRWEYNDDGRVTRVIHPNGNETGYVYEADLNPTPLPTQRGNVREIHHLPGAHAPAGDQADIVESFEYLRDVGGCCGFNFVTRYVDGRGNETRYEYDERGNRTRSTRAIPSVIDEWEYNQFGQMTAHVHPDNGSNHRRRDEYAYYASGAQAGYLSRKTVDSGGLNLATSYEYDPVGNLIHRIDPDGNDAFFEVNALNQVVREVSRAPIAASPIVRYVRDIFYDANGNVVRTDVLNLDESGQARSNLSLTTVYEYDTLNKLTAIARERGDFNGDIPGTPDAPQIAGLPTDQFVISRFEYDANRNLTGALSGEAVAGRQPGAVVRILYDERNKPFRITRGAGSAQQSTAQLDYDKNGNAIRVVSGLEGSPHVATWTYDGYNRVVSRLDPMGNETRSNYDAAGNIVRELRLGELNDVAGSSANVRLAELSGVFDALNRRTRSEKAFLDPATQAAIDDGASAQEFVWSDISRVLSMTNDNGHAVSYAYDSANRLSRVTDAKGNTTSYVFDPMSNVTRITEIEKPDLGGADETFVTTISYDGLNRRSRAVDNIGNTHRYAYDSRGNMVRYTDARGNVIRREFDGLNRLLSTIRQLTDTGDGSGRATGEIVTSQTWDDNSRVTSRTDDNGNSTLYDYDALGRMVMEVMADQTQHVYTYDVHGNRVTSLDANGSRVTSTYDTDDRLVANAVERGPGVLGTTAESFAYDGLSRLVRATDDDSVVTRAYDSLSNLLLETQNGQNVACTFDGVGNMTTCRYPGGRLIMNTFDELERKQTISDEDGMIATYAFIGPRRVAQRDYGNDTRMTVGYDGARRIISTTHVREPEGAAEVIDARTYAWDAMNNKTQRRDVRAGGPGLTHDYSYDSVNRLIQTRVTDPQEVVQRLTRYVLDGVHNRIRVEGVPDDGEYVGEYTLDVGPPGVDAPVNQYTATPFDARTYDDNGNLRSREGSASGPELLHFDFRDRLVEFTGTSGVRTTYAYDVFGRRIAKVVGVTGPEHQVTRFYHNDWQEIEEQDAAGAVVATYVFAHYVDEVLGMHRADQNYYYHADDMYNVVALSNAQDDTVERYEFSDYGQPRIMDGDSIERELSAVGNALLFNGRREDTESHLYYYRTRYLDSSVAQFVTRDTIGLWGDTDGLGSGTQYVGIRPWTRLDPYGLRGAEHANSAANCLGKLVSNPESKADSRFTDFMTCLGEQEDGYKAYNSGHTIVYGDDEKEERHRKRVEQERERCNNGVKPLFGPCPPPRDDEYSYGEPDVEPDHSPAPEPDQCEGRPSPPRPPRVPKKKRPPNSPPWPPFPDPRTDKDPRGPGPGRIGPWI